MIQPTYLILFTVSILLSGTCMGTSIAEKDDEITKHDVDVLCDASEDYEENKEQCDKLYDLVEDDEDDD